MHYTILPDQREHFVQKGYVEFEGLVSEEERTLIRQAPLGRGNPNLRKMVVRRALAEIAAELAGYAPLRLAYDEVVEHLQGSLLERSGFQGIVGGVLISTSGLATFVSAEHLIECSERSLLIVYGEVGIRYVKNEKDPYNHLLKDQGLVFGDRVDPKIHPILIKKRVG